MSGGVNADASSMGVSDRTAQRPKRVRERDISEIVKAVAMWRRLYSGIMKEGGVLVRYTLEDAAKKVGMSKKTLDDYLHLIRLGLKFKFAFKDRQNEKVGQLRKFINLAAKKEKADAKANQMHQSSLLKKKIAK